MASSERLPIDSFSKDIHALHPARSAPDRAWSAQFCHQERCNRVVTGSARGLSRCLCGANRPVHPEYHAGHERISRPSSRVGHTRYRARCRSTSGEQHPQCPRARAKTVVRHYSIAFSSVWNQGQDQSLLAPAWVHAFLSSLFPLLPRTYYEQKSLWFETPCKWGQVDWYIVG